MPVNVTANSSHRVIIIAEDASQISTPMLVAIIIGSTAGFFLLFACVFFVCMPWRRIWRRVRPTRTSRGVRELELRVLRNRQEQGISRDLEAACVEPTHVEPAHVKPATVEPTQAVVAQINHHPITRDGMDRNRRSWVHIHIKQPVGNLFSKRPGPCASS